MEFEAPNTGSGASHVVVTVYSFRRARRGADRRDFAQPGRSARDR
jgi:hypothetical protein